MNSFDFLLRNLRWVGPMPDGPQLLCFYKCLISFVTSSYLISSNCCFDNVLSIVPKSICFGSGWYELKSYACSSSVNGGALPFFSYHCSILLKSLPIPSTSSNKSAYLLREAFSYFSEFHFGLPFGTDMLNYSKNSWNAGNISNGLLLIFYIRIFAWNSKPS